MVKTRDGVGVARGRDHRAGALSEACRTVLNLPDSCIAPLCPGKVNAGQGDVGGIHILRSGAGWDEVKHKVVDKAGIVAVGRLRRQNGDIAFQPVVWAEGNLVVGVGVGSDHDGVDRHEGALVRRIGNDTHHGYERVGAVVSRIEGELQVIDGIECGVNLRQDGHLVVIVTWGLVGVEEQGVAPRRGTRGIVVDNRVAGIVRLGTGVEVAPAVRQVIDSHRSRGTASMQVEIVCERQTADEGTLGAGGANHRERAHISAVAVRPHVEVIQCGGIETAEGVGVARDCVRRASAMLEARRTVLNLPNGGIARLRPGKVNAVHRGTGGCHIYGNDAGGQNIHHDIVDIAGIVAVIGWLRCHNGDIAFRPVVQAEGNLVVGIGVGGGHDGIHRHEGAFVRRVGNDTHHRRERVVAFVSRVEGELQVVGRVECGINRRQDRHLVVIIA